MQTSSRKFLIVLVGLILTGFVVYQSSGFIHKANFSGQKLLHAVAGADLYLLLLPVIVIYGCYAIRALRWQLFQGNLGDRKSTRLNSSHVSISYAVFCLKKKKKIN